VSLALVRCAEYSSDDCPLTPLNVGWPPLYIPALGLEPNNADAKKEVYLLLSLSVQ
jgi:hypothetical protein